MGHYDDCYEYDADQRRKELKADRKKAKDALEKALRHSDCAANPDQFVVNIKQALFWLEEDR